MFDLQDVANRIVSSPIIAFDCETWDPDLTTKGPGFVRGNAMVVGVALAWLENGRLVTKYLAISHEGGGNMDKESVLTMLMDSFAKRKGPAVAANISYDLEALHRHGVDMTCPVYDIQIAEALLDENRRSYKLDTLAQDYLGERKLTETLTQTVVDKLGVKRDKAMANIWRLPAQYVDEYARSDADLTLRVWQKQELEIVRQDLCRVWQLECDLVPVLHAMRWHGVRIDVDGAERLVSDMAIALQDRAEALKCLTGEEVQIWAGASITAAAKHAGAPSLVEPGEKDSFTSPAMEKNPHPFFVNLVAARRVDKAITYAQSLLDYQIKGRVHCQYCQTRGDRGGARSGRLSASHPNLQAVPGRYEELAKPIRQLFLPDEGELWASNDYSQAEPRILVHYAYAMGLTGAAEARQSYIDNPSIDYHQMVADMCGGIARFPAKTINLGLFYGQGKTALAAALGMSIEEATLLFAKYHAGVPYVRELAKRCTQVAIERGYVKTITGRRRRFDLWGPRRWEKGMVPKKFDEAKEEWGPNVTRYFTHKAMNAVVQGTAADICKTAMVALHREGILPLMSIHDDLPCSVPSAIQGSFVQEVKYIMETCLPLSVPHLVEPAIGPTWGDCK